MRSAISDSPSHPQHSGPTRRRRQRPTRLALAGGLVLWLAGSSAALPAIIRVGEGDGCTGVDLTGAVLVALFNGTEADSIYMTGTPQVVNSSLLLNLELMGNVSIVGGFANCTDALPGTGRTSISTPHSDGLVVQGGIAGGRTFLLQGVSWVANDLAGRILDLSQRLVATLDNAWISNGYSAGNGGNIRMTGPDVVLILDGGSQVANGDATKGAGIFCSGGGSIGLLDGKIYHNIATSDGGGLYLDACTFNDFAGQATIGDCFSTPRGVICNQAYTGAGGGIFAANGATVNLVGGAAAPVVVHWDIAGEGAGVYGPDAGTVVDATNTRFYDNAAVELGAGVLVRQGASFRLISDVASCGGESPCSSFRHNHVPYGGGLGGAVAVDSGGRAEIFQTELSGNSAAVNGSVVYVTGDRSSVLCEGCLVWGNALPINESFFDTDAGGLLKLAYSTVDEDVGCCGGLFDTNAGSTVEIYSSILMTRHPNGLGRVFEEVEGAGEHRVADCILRSESEPSLPPPSEAVSYEVIADEAALFVDLAGRDYHLRSGSQAEDFCDTYFYPPQGQDSDLEARGQDDPDVANAPYGPYDLGFDEHRSLLKDGFEAGSCVKWSIDSGGC